MREREGDREMEREEEKGIEGGKDRSRSRCPLSNKTHILDECIERKRERERERGEKIERERQRARVRVVPEWITLTFSPAFGSPNTAPTPCTLQGCLAHKKTPTPIGPP